MKATFAVLAASAALCGPAEPPVFGTRCDVDRQGELLQVDFGLTAGY
jgi:hypothetical protein